MKNVLSRLVWALLAVCVAGGSPGLARAGDGEEDASARQEWPFAGFTGQFDRAQLRRGFHVYSQVCAGCHGLSRLSFRNLAQKGGPGFPEEAVKTFAAAWANRPLTLDDAGKTVERAATLADPILGPFRNDKEARAAQGGALPPDLSVIAKARGLEHDPPFYEQAVTMLVDIASGYQEGGADYMFAVLTGYAEAPKYVPDGDGGFIPLAPGSPEDPKAVACASVVEGEDGAPDVCNPPSGALYYNTAFPGHQIAMPPPVSADNFVTYQDGSGNLEQNARDVAAFLSWAADPHLDARKQTGWQAMFYLLILTVLLYLAKRRIWKNVP